MIVIKFVKLLSECGVSSFHEPRPSQSLERWVTLCGVVGQMKCPRTAGLGYMNKIQQ